MNGSKLGEWRAMIITAKDYCLEGKREIGGLMRRWEDNIKMVFRKWSGGMGWIELAQDMNRWPALVNAVMNLRVSQIAGIS